MTRDFRRYWAGQTLSGLGDAFSIVAVPLMALEATRDVAAMGQLAAAAALAHLAAGLAAAPVLARVARRRLMVACDLLRFAAWAGAAAWWRWRGPSIPALTMAVALSAFLGNLFLVASVSAVARLVDREELGAANGRLQGTYAAMFFVGPWAAGELCHRLGASAGVAVDAVSFLASAASLASVRRELSGDDAPEGAASLAEGMRFLWRVPRLRALTALLAASTFLLASRENLLVYYVKHTLRGSDAAVGRIFAAASLGAVAGAALGPAVRARVGFSAAWAGAGVAAGAAIAAASAVDSIAAIGAFAFVVALGDSVRAVTSLTVQQQSVPERLLGPVTAATQVLLTAPAAVGAWAAARFAASFDAGLALAATGLALAAVMTLGLFTPLRHPEGREQGLRGSVIA